MNKNDKVEEAVKKILEHAKPDEMEALQAIRTANDTIKSLYGQLQALEALHFEQFVVLGTILNKYGREVVLTKDDLIPLSPEDYAITVEPSEETDERIVRLRPISHLKGES